MVQRIALHPNAIERNVFRIAWREPEQQNAKGRQEKGRTHIDATDCRPGLIAPGRIAGADSRGSGTISFIFHVKMRETRYPLQNNRRPIGRQSRIR
jgi:hypothetical protein